MRLQTALEHYAGHNLDETFGITSMLQALQAKDISHTRDSIRSILEQALRQSPA